MKPLHIVQLTASNVKRLRAVSIKPDGNVVVLAGKNGQGKTSVLDAITYALAGTAGVCAEPVRRGEDRAEIVCDLGDIVVRRTFTAAGGTSLTVSNKEGMRYQSPQAVLDALTGRLTFDPLAFTRLPAKGQAEALRDLLGLDFADKDKRRDAAYAERTAVNKVVGSTKVRLAGMPHHADAPAAPVASADLIAEFKQAQNTNALNVKERRNLDAAKAKAEEQATQVNELRRRLQAAQVELDDTVRLVESLERHVATLQDVDLDPISVRLSAIDSTNAQVRANQARAAVVTELEAAQAKSAELTAEIEGIDRAKADAVAAAAMPVPGLGFSADGGVTLNGLPLEQASAAEQLRVSVAIGIAMNPQLRVLLIRDASLLDTDSMAMVAEMAEKAGAQVWLERVERDAAATVVIEDGQAIGVAEPVAAQEGGAS